MSIKLPKLNEPLIAKVLDHIKRFPESYDQNDVASPCDVTKGTPCGAIGCFGGWAVMLGMPKSQRHERAFEVDLGEGGKLVGLTSDERGYLFDAASGDPKDDLKTIKERLKNIREARNVLKVAKNVTSLTIETSDGTELTYCD